MASAIFFAGIEGNAIPLEKNALLTVTGLSMWAFDIRRASRVGLASALIVPRPRAAGNASSTRIGITSTVHRSYSAMTNPLPAGTTWHSTERHTVFNTTSRGLSVKEPVIVSAASEGARSSMGRS